MPKSHTARSQVEREREKESALSLLGSNGGKSRVL